ncbi:hypothetical protein M8D54_004956 [Salmonella enterica]|nr:hypothetical protein [Salmonella enterica]EJF2005539.1 hypothetical protein [Salmonella enterica]EJF2493111.1 hypothetical protein [Salmonella enterica]EJX7804519.1 hypothetical protein [Salmonella enterica]
MKILNDSNYELVEDLYKSVKGLITEFNNEIGMLNNQISFDILNDKDIDLFHEYYEKAIENFMVDFYKIINDVKEAYIPFLCILVNEYIHPVYYTKGYDLNINIFYFSEFGTELFRLIADLNFDIETVKEKTVYKYHRMGFAYDMSQFNNEEQELIYYSNKFEVNLLRLLDKYEISNDNIIMLMAIIIHEVDEVYTYSGYGFIDNLMLTIEKRIVNVL